MKVALITGASSGIGRATALALSRRGTQVTGLARRAGRLTELAEEIERFPAPHGEFLAVTGDVIDFTVMRDTVQSTLDRFGRLDMLIATAGVGHRGALVEADWTEVEVLLRTNIDGVLHSIRAAVPAIRQSGGGHIIITSSVGYNSILPYAAIYAASKAFVSSLSRSLSLELEADNIQVTDMLIGRTATEFNEKRLGKGERTGGGIPTMSAEQVAEAIVKATTRHKRTVVPRAFDRLILLGNLLLPGVVGRLAMRQYR
jgi:short-subunit dehydrogenase